MNNKENIQVLISDYVKGKLKGQALVDFENLLTLDKTLNQEVILEKEMHALFLDADLLDLKSKMNHDFEQDKPEKLIIRKWILSIGIAVLSGILILSAWSWLSKEKSVIEPANNRATLPKQKEKVIPENEKVNPNYKNKSEEKLAPTEPLIKHTEEKIATKIASTPEIKDLDTSDVVIQHLPPSLSDDTKEIEKQNTEKKAVENKAAPQIDPCLNLSFSGQTLVTKSEIGQSNGSLEVLANTIKGGKEPYSFALNDGRFSNQNRFENLEANKAYEIRIKDANGCISILNNKSEWIKETKCTENYQSTFSSSFEQEWSLPLVSNVKATIELRDKTGQRLIQKTIENEEEYIWNGIFDNGTKASVGRFNWYISYADGENCIVKMTIID